MSVFITAEIGLNANGSLTLAKELIDIAKDCGCHAVKFQKRSIETIYNRAYLESPRESPWGTTQADQKKAIEFGYKEYDAIDTYCRKQRIPWFASAWDIYSLEFLRKYDLPYNKVASAMLTNLPLVKAIAEEGKATFISTGMSTMADIEVAVDIFEKAKCKFSLLHCVGKYPARDEDSNLRMIQTLRAHYPHITIGYSGHTVGIQTYQMAVELGARVLEFHITLDRAMYGSDQAASIEPKGIRYIVQWCKDRDKILGDGIKRILPGEEENAKKLRYWEEKTG